MATEIPLSKRPTSTRCFAEWCSAGPTEYYPQRSVRDERYKLIVNYLKDRPNPSAAHYSSSGKFWEISPTLDEIASANQAMQEVYQTFANPPTEELYDLDTDPHEFINIADRPDCEPVLSRLRAELRSWQETTGDAILSEKTLDRLTSEHEAIVAEYYLENGWGSSRDYEWHYDEYLYITP